MKKIYEIEIKYNQRLNDRTSRILGGYLTGTYSDDIEKNYELYDEGYSVAQYFQYKEAIRWWKQNTFKGNELKDAAFSFNNDTLTIYVTENPQDHMESLITRAIDFYDYWMEMDEMDIESEVPLSLDLDVPLEVLSVHVRTKESITEIEEKKYY